jgi:hypothetical protein
MSITPGLTSPDYPEWLHCCVNNTSEANCDLFAVEAVVDEFFANDPLHSVEIAGAGDSYTKLDLAIRAEYPDMFEDPKGLLPRRPNLGAGDFCNHLIPGSKPPHRLPYRMTPAERDEYTKQILEFK